MYLSTNTIRIFLLTAVVVAMTSCSEKKVIGTKVFYDIDSLVSLQIANLKNSHYELSKFVEIDGKQETVRYVPDSTQWATELDIFRQLDDINKASFRDAYVMSDSRDSNSNLTIREIRAQRPTPVSVVRFYFLQNPSDLRKIEAVWNEENALYKDTRRLTMEFEPSNRVHLVHRYRVEGFQKMVMDDSVRFVIAGEISM